MIKENHTLQMSEAVKAIVVGVVGKEGGRRSSHRSPYIFHSNTASRDDVIAGSHL